MTRDEIAKDIMAAVEKAADIHEIFDAVGLGLNRMWEEGYQAGLAEAHRFFAMQLMPEKEKPRN